MILISVSRLTQRVHASLVHSLLACVILLLVCSPRVDAGESFTLTTDLYTGIDLASGMTDTDPTVITLIIGDGQEIDLISAPGLDPLFEFSPTIDLFFGLSTDPTLPITVTAENLTGITVIRDTALSDFTEEMLADLVNDRLSATIDSNDLVVVWTTDEEYILLGDIIRPSATTVQFTYRAADSGAGGGTDAIPEPGTCLLLGVGIVGLLVFTQWKRQHHVYKGENI